jgi:DNA-binding NarL/FixJ family response regulator
LSRRECATLTALARGEPLKDIAETLDVAVGTASKFASRAYEKLGAGSRIEAIAIHRRVHGSCGLRASHRR